MDPSQIYVQAALQDPIRHARRIQSTHLLITQGEFDRLSQLITHWFGAEASLDTYIQYLREYGLHPDPHA